MSRNDDEKDKRLISDDIKEIDGMKEDLNKTENDLKATDDKAKSLGDQITELMSMIGQGKLTGNKQVESFNRLIGTLRIEITDLEEQHKKNSKNINGLSQRSEPLIKKFNATFGEVNRLQESLKGLNADSEKAKKELLDSAIELNDLDKFLAEKGAILDQYTSNIEKLEKIEANLTKDIEDAKTSNAQIQKSLEDDLKAKRLEHSKAVQAMSSEIEELTNTKGNLNSEIVTFTEALKKAKEFKTALEGEIQALGVNKATLQDEVQALGEGKATLQGEIQTLGEGKSALQSEIQALGEGKATLQDEIQALGEGKATLQGEIQALGEEIESLKDAKLGLENTLSGLKQAIDTALGELDNLKGHIQKAESEYSKKSLELNEVSAQLTEKEKSFADLKAEYNNLDFIMGLLKGAKEQIETNQTQLIQTINEGRAETDNSIAELIVSSKEEVKAAVNEIKIPTDEIKTIVEESALPVIEAINAVPAIMDKALEGVKLDLTPIIEVAQKSEDASNKVIAMIEKDGVSQTTMKAVRNDNDRTNRKLKRLENERGEAMRELTHARAMLGYSLTQEQINQNAIFNIAESEENYVKAMVSLGADAQECTYIYRNSAASLLVLMNKTVQMFNYNEYKINEVAKYFEKHFNQMVYIATADTHTFLSSTSKIEQFMDEGAFISEKVYGNIHKIKLNMERLQELEEDGMISDVQVTLTTMNRDIAINYLDSNLPIEVKPILEQAVLLADSPSQIIYYTVNLLGIASCTGGLSANTDVENYIDKVAINEAMKLRALYTDRPDFIYGVLENLISSLGFVNDEWLVNEFAKMYLDNLPNEMFHLYTTGLKGDKTLGHYRVVFAGEKLEVSTLVDSIMEMIYLAQSEKADYSNNPFIDLKVLLPIGFTVKEGTK